MASEKWSALTSRGDVLTTQLNALQNGSKSAVGATVDNATNKDRFAVARLEVTFNPNTPTDESVIDLYQFTQLDAVNYPDGSATVDPAPERWCGQFTVQGTSAAQILDTAPFALLPGITKFSAVNRAGTTMPATGTTIELFAFNREVN